MIADNLVYVGGSPYPHSDDEVFEQDGNKIWPIRIYCLDLLTEIVLWKTNSVYPYSAEHHRAIPAISDNHYPSCGRILCVEAIEGKLHMLNSLTGELLWIFDRNTGTTVRY